MSQKSGTQKVTALATCPAKCAKCSSKLTAGFLLFFLYRNRGRALALDSET